MPEISRLLGIVIVHGEFPGRARRLALEWAELRRAELLENWQQAREHKPLRDGTAGEIDLGPALHGPVFESVRDQEVFRQFAIHPEFHTLVWPNGADFAPEFLHDNIRVTA